MIFQRIIAVALLAITLAACGSPQPAQAAGTAQSIQFLLSQVRTTAGPLAGGKVYFYSAGTATLKTVWLNRGKTTVAANPYTLDSNATAQLYGDGIYRIVIKDSAGITKYDRDNLEFRDFAGNVTGNVADYGTLAAAVTAIGSTRMTLEYATDQTLAANIVIPANIELVPINGAVINHSTYAVSYAGGTAKWPMAQIFSGTGAVSGFSTVRPEWFGPVGAATDQVVFQKAAAALGTSGGVIECDPHATYRVFRIYLYAGTHLKLNGATVKQIDNSGGDFGRMFDNNVAGYIYTGAVDSNPIIIEGGILDCNRANQGTYLDYSKQHHAAVAVNAAADSVGKLVVKLRDLVIKESVGDGINVEDNVKITVENVHFWNNFRGGFTVSGSGNIINIVNVTSGGNVHDYFTNIEPALSSPELPNVVNITNAKIGAGLDISSNNSVGSRYNIKNVAMTGYGLILHGGDDPTSTWVFEDCILGTATDTGSDTFRKLYDATFNRCKLIAYKSTGAVVATVAAVYINNDGLVGTYKFNQCAFVVGSSVQPTDTSYGVYRTAEAIATRATVKLTDCTLTGFDYGLYNRGGVYQTHNVNADGVLFYLNGTLGVYNDIVDISGKTYSALGSALAATAGSAVPVAFDFTNYEIDAGNGSAGAGYNTLLFAGFTNITKKGRRVLYVTDTPTGGAFAGDIAIHTAPLAAGISTWIATTTHNTAATWKATSTLAP